MISIIKVKKKTYGSSKGLAKQQSNSTRTSTMWAVNKIDDNGNQVIDKNFPMYFGTKREAQEYVKNIES